jgi:Fic family protein
MAGVIRAGDATGSAGSDGSGGLGGSASDPLAAVAALPGVADAVRVAREAVDAVSGHRVLRSRSSEVAAESLLRGARASAALAGADWPLEELRRRTAFGTDPADAPVRAALRVVGELGALRPVWRTAPAQALSRLHVLAAAGSVPEASVGRPRTAEPTTSDVEPTLAGLAGDRRLVPARSVPDRLALLSDTLRASTAPALVVAAVAHGELLALAPFGWGDGLIARAAFRLTVVERGLDPKGLLIPELGLYEAGDRYPAALAGYLGGGRDGLAGWIGFCADALAASARETLAICEALLRG